MSLSWSNIDVYAVESPSLFGRMRGRQRKATHILKNVSGQCQPGQLLAIIGSSGAGKTTLMNVLTARNLSKLSVRGTVRINGQVADIDTITALSAYVQQDDLFIGTLTVREHLLFQSWVRMDRSIKTSVRIERVNHVLHELGLAKCADTMIGWPGWTKGISGGEMKRLAFASEVLTNPSIMFCDEPTSGLDSFMAQSVVGVLRDMAEAGRTIVCTIHQPSSEVFAMFDQLLLMAEGRIAYMGPTNDALGFFSSLGYQCPKNYNPADFYIQQLAIRPGNEEDCKSRVRQICDEYEKSDLRATTIQSISNGDDMHIRSDSFCLEPGQTLTSSRSVYKSGWWTQFAALLWRCVHSLLREPLITSVRTVQTVSIALLLGAIYYGQTTNQEGVQNINGALFLLLTNMTFQNAYAVINTFCMELPIFTREHNNGMYRVSTYFLAKTMAELPFFIILPALFVCIYYWMIGFNPTFESFIICVSVAVMVSNCASSFGYFVSCISSSMTMALSLGPPIIIPFLIFGGFFLNNRTTPDYFIWLKYLSWFYYGNEILVVNQWHSIDKIDCDTSGQLNATATGQAAPPVNCLLSGSAVIEQLGMNPDNMLRDALVLIAIIIGFRMAAFISLYFRVKRLR